jgi:hypothetical protein
VIIVLAIAAPGAVEARADRVDDYVRAQMKSRNLPGLSLAVVVRGKVAKTEGYGVASLELDVPATRETVYEIGSISKQITADAILLLVEAGKVQLDDPISRYLDDPPAAWAPITVRHVLTHTSGLADFDSGQIGFSCRREYSAREFVELLGRQPLQFAPGERWRYTNAFPLLGMVVERASGQYDARDEGAAIGRGQCRRARSARTRQPIAAADSRAPGAGAADIGEDRTARRRAHRAAPLHRESGDRPAAPLPRTHSRRRAVSHGTGVVEWSCAWRDRGRPLIATWMHATASGDAAEANSRLCGVGAPGRIRTCGLWLRRPTLYPAELRAHWGVLRISGFRILIPNTNSDSDSYSAIRIVAAPIRPESESESES